MATFNPLSFNRENQPSSIRRTRKAKVAATPSLSSSKSSMTPLFSEAGPSRKVAEFQTPRHLFGDLTNANASTPANVPQRTPHKSQKRNRRKEFDLSSNLLHSHTGRNERDENHERILENKQSTSDIFAKESLYLPRMSINEESLYSAFRHDGLLDFRVDDLMRPKKRHEGDYSVDLYEKIVEYGDILQEKNLMSSMLDFPTYPSDQLMLPEDPNF